MLNSSTQLLLQRTRRGDTEARDKLYDLLYANLRELAASQLRRERRDHTLTPTALVHEAYLALAGSENEWQDQSHVLALASRAMRQVLVDYARRRHTHKRGGGAVHVRLDDLQEIIPTKGLWAGWMEEEAGALLDLDRVLTELSQRNERFGHVVECRVFGGLTVPETATALGLSPATVDRTWAKARAYLLTALADGA